MTNDEAKALGLRALAAGFPGLVKSRRVWTAGAYRRSADGVLFRGMRLVGAHGDGWPDFHDPATLGVLLAQVREAWEPHRGSDYIASTMHTGTGWGVRARYGSEGLATIVECTHETEAEALVAALEAAPWK